MVDSLIETLMVKSELATMVELLPETLKKGR